MYENYCKIRDAKGYKDSDVSKGSGVTKSTFSDWKTGRSVPKHDKLVKIAAFLGTTVDDLLAGNIEWNPSEQEIVENDYYFDEKTKEMAQFLYDNPEYKVLFDATRRVKPEDLSKALRAIGLFIDEKK